MYFVTGPAGSPFLLDDMNIMEVSGAVSEVGQLCSHLILDNILIVTFKAHSICCWGERCIELRGIVFQKEVGIRTAVRFVARITVTLFYRTVLVLGGFNLLFKVLMAGKTDGFQTGFQLFFKVRGMNCVTIGTFSILHGAMLDLGRLHVF